MYALFQHELKRLLALHSIENIGIIVLGLGACLVLRARGADEWAAFALAAALLHTLNHAVFKALLFLGAGAFEKAVGALELDRLGGLLRRMPWTGGAFLVGAMAIAGLPPLNGFASEWLTLQALLHVPAYGPRRRRRERGGRAGGARGDRGSRGLLLRQGRRPRRCSARRARRHAAAAIEAPWPMRGALVFLAVACVVLGVAPGLLFGSLVGLAPWPAGAPEHVGLPLPGTGSLPTAGIAARPGRLRGRARRSCAAGGEPQPAPTWACGQLVEPALNWTSAGFTQAAPARARGGPAPRAGDRGAPGAAGSSRRSPTAAACRT